MHVNVVHEAAGCDPSEPSFRHGCKTVSKGMKPLWFQPNLMDALASERRHINLSCCVILRGLDKDSMSFVIRCFCQSFFSLVRADLVIA